MFLATISHIGFTAHFGLTEIGQSKPSTTLVVSTARITPWLKAGKLKYRIDLVERSLSAASALNKLFDRANIGKVMVKVSEELA